MPTTRFALLTAATCLAACTGLDPRRLERLEYGMEQRHVAELLEEPSMPAMRFFVPDAQGREQDVRIEFLPGAQPHADYALMSIDGRLASVALAAVPPHYLGRQWWRDEHHWDHREFLCPWWPDELQGIVDDAGARRLELAWNRLEPIDSSCPTSGRYSALGMATVFVFPIVVYTPYYLGRELFDGRYDRAVAARAFLLEAPRETTVDQIVAQLGPFTSERTFTLGHSSQRVLTYDLPGTFRLTIGFVDGRLSWIDFGRWSDWSWSFANMDVR